MNLIQTITELKALQNAEAAKALAAECEGKTCEQLCELMALVAGARDTLKAAALAVTAAHDKQDGIESAQRKLAAMSDPERAALAQLLAPSGVPSAEAFGVPGSK